MTIQEQKLEKFKELMKIASESLTREEFTSAFKQVVDLVKKIAERSNTEMILLASKYDSIVNGMKSDCAEDMVKLKKDAMDYCMKEMEAMMKKDSEMMKSMKSEMDAKMAEMVVPDTEEVALEATTIALDALKPLIPSIESIEQDLPKLGDKIRDGLEILQGDERLEISAIKDLQEKLDELKAIKSKTFGGGGFSYIAMDQHFIDDETPSGTVNGVNKDFVLAHTPSPVTSLKVYRGGARQRLTEDYTLSGNTITFIVAPVVGEILTCDYRV